MPAAVVMHGMPPETAAARMRSSSARSCLPSGVLKTMSISRFLIRSTMCGRPSWTLLTRSTGTLPALRTRYVPSVARIS